GIDWTEKDYDGASDRASLRSAKVGGTEWIESVVIQMIRGFHCRAAHCLRVVPARRTDTATRVATGSVSTGAAWPPTSLMRRGRYPPVASAPTRPPPGPNGRHTSNRTTAR